jgi:hypothetical protein
MTKLASALLLLGAAGVMLGILAIVHTATDPSYPPFGFENHGGPGPVLGSLILLAGGLYLLSTGPRED